LHNYIISSHLIRIRLSSPVDSNSSLNINLSVICLSYIVGSAPSSSGITCSSIKTSGAVIPAKIEPIAL